MSEKIVKPVDDAVREQYDKVFDSKWYVNTYYKDVFTGEEITLRKLNDLFTQGKLKGPLKRSIDIGCGPIVHRLSAPSKVCDTLVYSDFSSNNRKLVQDWINGPGNDPDHLVNFKFCAKLEGFDDLEKGANVIENRIKSKVKGVEPINILIPQPMGQLDEPFDVAFSGACLEGACDSKESLFDAIKNIASLIRPGGYLILKGYLDCSFYIVNGVEFPSFPVSDDMIKKGLVEGGFSVLEYEIICDEVKEQMGEDKEYANSTGNFFAVAQKL